jgi:hypothetical protein
MNPESLNPKSDLYSEIKKLDEVQFFKNMIKSYLKNMEDSPSDLDKIPKNDNEELFNSYEDLFPC